MRHIFLLPVLFSWMPDFVNFMLQSAGFCWIPLRSIEFVLVCSYLQISLMLTSYGWGLSPMPCVGWGFSTPTGRTLELALWTRQESPCLLFSGRSFSNPHMCTVCSQRLEYLPCSSLELAEQRTPLQCLALRIRPPQPPKPQPSPQLSKTLLISQCWHLGNCLSETTVPHWLLVQCLKQLLQTF